MRHQLPIVGARFRPPAEDVLNLLPAGTALLLRRQPENPYDENAIQVLLVWQDEGELEATVLQCAEEASAQIDNTVPLHLGYIPREHAQVLAPLMDAEENKDIEKDADGVVVSMVSKDIEGKLSFSVTGKPEVEFEL